MGTHEYGVSGKAEQPCELQSVDDEDRCPQELIGGYEEPIAPVRSEAVKLEGAQIRRVTVGRLVMPHSDGALGVAAFAGRLRVRATHVLDDWKSGQ